MGTSTLKDTNRISQIAMVADELDRCVRGRGSLHPETRFGFTLGELDWLTELHRLLYEENMRTFDTGATRDTDKGKLDFEGFLSPYVLERYAQYMHSKRDMPNGSLRDSDNWQRGIPMKAYMQSLWRHFFAVWKAYRTGDLYAAEDELCAVMFNSMGLLHELLSKGRTCST
jgi:hypothetical protein